MTGAVIVLAECEHCGCTNARLRSSTDEPAPAACNYCGRLPGVIYSQGEQGNRRRWRRCKKGHDMAAEGATIVVGRRDRCRICYAERLVQRRRELPAVCPYCASDLTNPANVMHCRAVRRFGAVEWRRCRKCNQRGGSRRRRRRKAC